MEQFGGWYQKERKLPGSGGGAPGGGTPLPGRFAAGPLAPQAPKPAPPGFRIQTDPVLHGPCPLLETSFSQGDQGKRKRGLFSPVSFMRFTDAYQNCPECR